MTSSAGVSFFSGPTAMRDKPRFLWGPYFWFVPAVTILLIVTLYPSAFVVWISLQKTRYHDLIGFAGLANYVEVLGSREFWDTTLISLIYVVGSLTGAIILGMAAALALNAAGTIGTLLQSPSHFSLDAVYVGCWQRLALAFQPIIRAYSIHHTGGRN